MNWNEYQWKAIIQTPNQYLDYLIDPCFQGVCRHFILWFQHGTFRTIHTRYFLPIIEIKDYTVMIDARIIFEQPLKTDLRIYDNIRKTETIQEDDYTTGCLLYCSYIKNAVIWSQYI